MAFKRIKFRASNSQDNYYTEKKLKGMINHFEKKASQYLELLEYNDDEERKNPPPQFNREDMTKKLEYMEE